MADQKTVLTILAKDKTAAAFKSIQAGAAKTAKVVGRLSIVFGKFGIASATAAAGATAALTKMSMTSIDNLAKTADKIGATTETLAGLQHAANLTGVSTETMNMALQRMTRRVAEAAIGTGEAKGALEELGINAQELVNLPLDQQMAIVADAMKGVGTQADRVRLAMKLFDSEGVALVNTLGGGSEALREMMNETKALNTALSRVDAARVEAANDAIGNAKAVFAGVGNQLAVAFADQIAFAANMFRQAALDAEGFGTIGQRVANAVAVGFGRLADFLHRTVLLGKQIQLAFVNMAQGVLESIGPDSIIIKALDFLIGKYNSIASILGFDTIPTAAEGLENLTAGFGQKADELKAEIKEMMLSPLPSKEIMARLEEITAGARKMAEEVAASTPAAVAAAGEVVTATKDKAAELQSSISDALISGVTDGKDGMLRSFSNILTQMASEVLKSQLMSAFKSIFPGSGGTGGLGSIFGAIGSFFGGARAEGGSVTAGRAYLVGERGPELMVPGRSGTIVANENMGGAGLNYAPVVNISGGASEQDRALFLAELRNQKAQIADMLARRRF